ncbi:hypothetical protein EGH21_22400 [Halomicroarcula sp. F13]|uniref:Uncharacterized protein n=1 Tax=Haloarcula rubra TaxID=2487747 RepID=A0AAW4PX94_9EURY|nr:hypothetical protein [Halomicroarcula rubra]MBX0325772.1 hypothetical protein [Halomicroarcula rubra]
MSNADDTQNDTEQRTEPEPHHRLASKFRCLADELERAGRQLASDDLDVDVHDGEATIVATYDLTEDYDLEKDPEGLTEPETVTDGGQLTDAEAAMLIEGVITAAEPALEDDEVDDLATAAGHLRDGPDDAGIPVVAEGGDA